MRNKASILIVSLWLLIFLSVLTVALGKLVSSQITFCRFYLARLSSYYLAKAAVKEAVVERENDFTSTYDSLYELRKVREIIFGNDRVEYHLIDEESKININFASREIMQRLKGFTEELAEKITEARSIKVFEVPEDILSIEGIDKEKFYGKDEDSGLKDLVTVYGDGKVNINTASYEVLFVLLNDSSLARRIVDFRKGSDGEEVTGDDGVFYPGKSIVDQLRGVSALESLSLAKAVGNGLTTIKSHNYTIKISSYRIKQETGDFWAVYSSHEKAIKLWVRE